MEEMAMERVCELRDAMLKEHPGRVVHCLLLKLPDEAGACYGVRKSSSDGPAG